MSVKYRIIKRAQPGVAGGGSKKHYACAKTEGEVNLDELTKSIEKRSTVSGADIRAVLYALVDIAVDELADSKIVRLGDLGSLRLSLSSNGYDTADEINASAIKKSKVLFLPVKRLKEMQKSLTYKETK